MTAEWDDEARVWVATSDDIPGLVTEAATLDDLFGRVLQVAPELLDDNGVPSHAHGPFALHIHAELAARV